MVHSDPFSNCAAEKCPPSLKSKFANRIPGLTSLEVGFDESMGASRSGSTMSGVFRKLAVICALFFLLQNLPQLERKNPTDLRKKVYHWRGLSQHELNKREENVSGSNEELDKLWKKELIKWKSDLYLINKETFWEFKRVCKINNVDFKWENEIWKKFREQMGKNIYEKELKDHQDFSKLKSNKPTEEEINNFILSKRDTFGIFCDYLKNERTSLIDHVIKEWIKVRGEFLDTVEYKAWKVRKLLKKMQKKEVAKLYS
ncbi:hypothetical protein PCYB_074290 [Plasmodium cynomolgi strain B]|uniref:Plasmodium RESA N-terminal domain-containing protein n=1 Tax=Plasmodium cynomolgi (strain B) TaxID=1120755 RepID=K6UJG3_PLACD|nr:hypothetical protein PCYB_074290 [Plasmodium cynomolgi strain B]GAB65928.1 hypothetical protein PCYB_074290 [Plasmodium cynomolgi strain B]